MKLHQSLANIPDLFEDSDLALKLLLDSPYAIPLYNNGARGANQSGHEYYPIAKKLNMEAFYHYQKPLPIEILRNHLKEAKYSLRNYFRFPGETRKERDGRNHYESKINKTFLEWYKERNGQFPLEGYSEDDYMEDFKIFVALGSENRDSKYDDKDMDCDDEDTVDISSIRDCSINNSYVEIDVPFADDAGPERWDS